eukprot:62269-Chlamydomonas_euryale.AAC.5
MPCCDDDGAIGVLGVDDDAGNGDACNGAASCRACGTPTASWPLAGGCTLAVKLSAVSTGMGQARGPLSLAHAQQRGAVLPRAARPYAPTRSLPASKLPRQHRQRVGKCDAAVTTG